VTGTISHYRGPPDIRSALFRWRLDGCDLLLRHFFHAGCNATLHSHFAFPTPPYYRAALPDMHSPHYYPAGELPTRYDIRCRCPRTAGVVFGVWCTNLIPTRVSIRCAGAQGVTTTLAWFAFDITGRTRTSCNAPRLNVSPVTCCRVGRSVVQTHGLNLARLRLTFGSSDWIHGRFHHDFEHHTAVARLFPFHTFTTACWAKTITLHAHPTALVPTTPLPRAFLDERLVPGGH